MDILKWLKKNWWIFALAVIVLISFWVRTQNMVPDKILGYDPTFQYRFTKYISDWGHLPDWDELTYYVGRSGADIVSPLMLYVTALIHSILKNFGFSLLTTAAYMSAVYGAAISIPAFLLGKKLSNNYGGLIAAGTIGTAPQVLVRTFGGSYDTDQVALFFILFTLYLGIKFLEKKTIANYFYTLTGFLAAIMAWGLSLYTFAIIAASSALFFIIDSIFGVSAEKNIVNRFIQKFKQYKFEFLGLVALFMGIYVVGILFQFDAIILISAIVGFVMSPEKWIVNISIAELQPFNIFNLQGWVLATGRIASGDVLIDNLILIIMVMGIVFGILNSFGKDNRKFSILSTLLILGIYTTFRGIRFTEFSSVILLTVIAVGLGDLIKFAENKEFIKPIVIGAAIFLIFTSTSIGMQFGQQLKIDDNPNWYAAWAFLRDETPKTSIVGTWWDPGHMIAALAERRNYADGAHCGTSCLYTINDRITDLGNIMATTSEEESLQLIKKYKGTSEKVYWIASDDLISKFQWLQYFGTGCDARIQPECPLYQISYQQSVMYNNLGEVAVRDYGTIKILPGIDSPTPLFIQGTEAFMFEEIITYTLEGDVMVVTPDDLDRATLIENLKPYEQALGITFAEGVIPLTIWIQKDFGYVVAIPTHLREAVFTKMFFLEGVGLENFKQVFRNEQVKIYEVDI